MAYESMSIFKMLCQTCMHVLIVNIPESVCSVKVCTHSAFAKSHIFTVVSPLVVANFVPLEEDMILEIHNLTIIQPAIYVAVYVSHVLDRQLLNG